MKQSGAWRLLTVVVLTRHKKHGSACAVFT